MSSSPRHRPALALGLSLGLSLLVGGTAVRPGHPAWTDGGRRGQSSVGRTLEQSRLMAHSLDSLHNWVSRQTLDGPTDLTPESVTQFLLALVARNPNEARLTTVGISTEQRDIYAYTFGRGNRRRVMVWSQVHGNEPTGTLALLDALAYLSNAPASDTLAGRIRDGLTIIAVPMVNPDGAVRRERRNGQGLDINRDAERLETPEGRTLRRVYLQLRPDFALDLHDQGPRRTTDGSLAAFALLAPTEPHSAPGTGWPMAPVAGRLATSLSSLAPGRIARYDDAALPSAFDDAMRRWGTPAVLLECGAWTDDPVNQVPRRLAFVALMTAWYSLATLPDDDPSRPALAKGSDEPYIRLPRNRD